MKETTMSKIIRLSLILLLFASCAEKDNSGNGTNTKTITIEPSVAWVNTGVVMQKGKIVEVTSDDTALGALFVRQNDPLFASRHGGLIGKLGKDERPFWVGKSSSITGNTMNQGTTLYLGRNDTDFTTSTSGPWEYQPMTITATITISQNSKNTISLVSPLDGSYSSDASPVFDWDDVDNTIQYRLQLSVFPDFRMVEQDINNTTSALNPVTAPPGSNVSPLSPLGSGVHYWRVRAYVNIGRVTSPILEWGDWSQVFSYGVETIGIPITPTVINPPQGKSFPLGDSILFEFTAPPQGSGLLWSYLFTSTTCGDSPSLSDTTTANGSPLPWYVFPMTIEPTDPNEAPPSYAFFTVTPDKAGEWLYRIEVRAGSDFDASSVIYFDTRISVGCP